jgi:hypothetical protein
MHNRGIEQWTTVQIRTAIQEQDDMKIHKRFLQKIALTVYNDSDIEWVVSSDKHGTMRFNRNHFTMTEAFDLYIRINTYEV